MATFLSPVGHWRKKGGIPLDPTLIGQRLLIALLFLMVFLPLKARGQDELASRTLEEINLARRDPRGYARIVAEFRRTFSGKAYILPGSETRVMTVEGVKGVDEAIRFLKRQHPLPPLGWSPGLAAAAEELVLDQGASGGVGHRGSDGSGPRERVERHGTWQRAMGENIYYGPGDARLVVMSLIIDDDVPGRGHRKNIFSPSFGRAGAKCGPHPEFTGMCVIDFAAGFSETETTP